MEHIVLCIPLMLLKRSIKERNNQLSDVLPPLNEELYSTFIVNLLLAIGITVTFVLPPIQYGLAHLYFVKGHPWSRLLNAKLRSE
jgi:inner membrane protein involved in colicin E2 resistance